MMSCMHQEREGEREGERGQKEREERERGGRERERRGGRAKRGSIPTLISSNRHTKRVASNTIPHTLYMYICLTSLITSCINNNNTTTNPAAIL